MISLRKMCQLILTISMENMGVFIGLVELNPIAEFAVILVVGILLFLAGRWCWKLLVNYCKKVGKAKSDLSI